MAPQPRDASRDDQGRIVGWHGHTEDIDDRRKAETALRSSERELRLLIDTVPTMIWLVTPAGLPYYFIKTVRRLGGHQFSQGGIARQAAVRLACGVVPSG
ncbi:hypothetical protein X743_11560 [Mesorhizobium sp. LNHC252B00]|nr:hypothetical protein X743_11560 [Mesorhizobium sp. LNHC252B00]